MFLAIAVVVLLLKTLFGGALVCFRIMLCTGYCQVELGTQAFGVRILSLLRFRLDWSAEDGILALQIKQNGETKILDILTQNRDKKRNGFGKHLFAQSHRWLKLDSLNADGCIGIRDDAFSCVMLSGMLDCALKTAFRIMLNKDTSPQVVIHPNFAANLFRLNLEGMFRINTVQIITAALKWYFQKRGSDNYVSPHRKHYENDYGAN